jgi:hypothetical protein
MLIYFSYNIENKRSMEKEFVPYELAVKFKALGFDEPCMAFYNGRFLDYKIQGGDICSPYLSTENRGECPNAPTFSQAFRWFREEYGLQSNVSYGLIFSFVINNKSYEDFPNSEDNWFRTFEEAELACLNKLIEIVETKEK